MLVFGLLPQLARVNLNILFTDRMCGIRVLDD
jgi:hypothetical protein